jgi:hypothetical protein
MGWLVVVSSDGHELVVEYCPGCGSVGLRGFTLSLLVPALLPLLCPV